mgnify:CR=1 FL=1
MQISKWSKLVKVRAKTGLIFARDREMKRDIIGEADKADIVREKYTAPGSADTMREPAVKKRLICRTLLGEFDIARTLQGLDRF